MQLPFQNPLRFSINMIDINELPNLACIYSYMGSTSHDNVLNSGEVNLQKRLK